MLRTLHSDSVPIKVWLRTPPRQRRILWDAWSIRGAELVGEPVGQRLGAELVREPVMWPHGTSHRITIVRYRGTLTAGTLPRYLLTVAYIGLLFKCPVYPSLGLHIVMQW